TTSPITGGCPNWRNSEPRKWPVTRTAVSPDDVDQRVGCSLRFDRAARPRVCRCWRDQASSPAVDEKEHSGSPGDHGGVHDHNARARRPGARRWLIVELSRPGLVHPSVSMTIFTDDR